MKKLFLMVLVCFSLSALAQTNFNVQFRSQLPYGSTVDLSNIWGYVDSLGNEYALVGAQTGLSIVDVTNPNNPIQKFFVPGTNSFWREVQVWGKYAYVTTEGCCNGLQIINLSNLPAGVTSKNWTGTGAVAGQVGRIHSVHIRNGYAYLNGSQLFGGASLIANLADPWNPGYVGNTQMSLSGNLRYVHDCYVRNDTMWAAHIYGGFYSVINVSNKAAPSLITTQATPGNYTHNTWLSDSGRRVLYTTDEVSNSVLAAYDVTSTGNMTLLDRLQNVPGSGSILHNTYIRNNFAVNSYYKDGIMIADVSRPDNLIVTGRYDTYTQGSGNGFNGAWGVYPYLPSGNILVSDIDNGLFVLTPTYVRACYLEGTVRDSCTNATINNVTVKILSGTHQDELSKLNGDYKTGTALAGTFTVTFSKTGYQTRSISNVSLQNGVLTALNVRMLPANAVQIAGGVVSNVLCNSASTGSIDLSISSGLAPVSYAWSSGAVSQDLNGLPAGSYTVTVTDAQGCTFSAVYAVTQPQALVQNSVIVQPSCSLATNGNLTVVVNGGTAPYNFQWNIIPPVVSAAAQKMLLATPANPPQAGSALLAGDTATLANVGAGLYQLVLTDNNGCSSQSTYTVNNPANPCSVLISMRVFVEGLYTGLQSMQPLLSGAATDTLVLQLRQAQAPFALLASSTATVSTTGWVTFTFPPSLWQQTCYLVIRHRNALETWSKVPLFIPAGSQQYILTDSSIPVLRPSSLMD